MRRLALALLTLLSAASAKAAALSITARLSQQEVSLNEQIVLSVTVTGPQASLPEPKMPALPNFSIYSSGRSQNISFVNGRVTSSIVHTYVLSPHFVGKGTIGPITVKAEGGTASTRPIEIRVHPPNDSGTGPTGRAARPDRSSPNIRAPQQIPAGGDRHPDLFVTAEVDKKNPYVNEQVVLTVKFHTSVPLLGNPQYTAPRTSGFLAEDLPPERHGNVVLGGREYYFSEIKTALFPAQSGPLTISPATVRCQVQRSVAVDPLSPDFFQNFFSQGMVTGQSKDLHSEPLMIEARPLPAEEKPAVFSGAVGNFTIAASIDNASPKVGEAVNLTVTVAGRGNLQSLGEPALPEMPHLRSYETVSSLNFNKNDDVVQGSKVFKTVLVPRVSGTTEIPSLSITYFDPVRKAYVTARSAALSIGVAPGEGSLAGPMVPAKNSGNKLLTTVSNDIRYLKTTNGRGPIAPLLEAVAGGGLFHSIPFILFAGVLGWTKFQERRDSDPKGALFRGALKAALTRIRKGEKESDRQKSTALLADSLSHFLADKLGEPSSGLTQRRALELLRAKGRLPEERLVRIKELWEEIDLRRFAPPSPSKGVSRSDKVSEALKALLKELDREIERS